MEWLREAERPLLVVTCMDPRVTQAIPPDAFVLRTAGASIAPLDDDLIVAVTVKGVHTIAVITHTDCAMRDPDPSLVGEEIAARAIGDERDAARGTAKLIAARFPDLEVRAYCFRVEDRVLEPLSRQD